MLLKRIITDVLLLVSLFVLPWWITLFVAFLLIFYFKLYFESIILAFFLDLLYSPINFSGVYLLTIFTIILFIIIEVLKNKLFFVSGRNKRNEDGKIERISFS